MKSTTSSLYRHGWRYSVKGPPRNRLYYRKHLGRLGQVDKPKTHSQGVKRVDWLHTAGSTCLHVSYYEIIRAGITAPVHVPERAATYRPFVDKETGDSLNSEPQRSLDPCTWRNSHVLSALDKAKMKLRVTLPTQPGAEIALDMEQLVKSVVICNVPCR